MDLSHNDHDSQASSNDGPTQSLRRSRRLNPFGAASEESSPSPSPPSPSSSESQFGADAAAASTATAASLASATHPVSRHHSTWVSQNRQMERQRSFYSNYYSNRNRNVTPLNSDASRLSTLPTPPAAEVTTLTWRRPRAGISFGDVEILGSSASIEPLSSRISVTEFRRTPSTLERTLDSTEIGEAEPVFNSAATQTGSSTPSSVPARSEPHVAPQNPEASSSSSPSAPRPISAHLRVLPRDFATNPHSPFHEYLQHLGAFISRTSPTILVSDLSQIGREHTTETDQVNDAVEHLNFEAIFGLHESPFFNNGLSKQEINRHTISYEYKSSLPLKRKRMKTEDGEAPAPPPVQTTNGTIEGCSICLDKLNPSVVVRRLPCLHIFHIKCIDKWLKQNKKCPICRIAININYDTLMSSLEAGSSIDQCLSQQETSSRQLFRPTITLQVQSTGALASLSSFTFTTPAPPSTDSGNSS